MRILILNWRDIQNPISGGAEVLTQEMAKRWVKWGHQVTQFSSAFPGGASAEIIDGVRIMRRGRPDARSLFLSVHCRALWAYVKEFRGRFDVVVDEIHGIPFFTPLFVKEKKIVLICEVAKGIWDQMFAFPWNILGKLAEKIYFKIYRNTHFLTISPSTEADLREVGIAPKRITILPMGVTLNLPSQLPAKEKVPVLIFVGRLCRMKGITEALEAFALIVKKFPLAKFWIVGNGEEGYVNELKELVKERRLGDRVKFWGFVSEAEKFKLLARAHLLLHPSRREGWGLVVHEANSVGTPVVAYNSPGLRDIVKDKVNGLLCRVNSAAEIAVLAISLLNHRPLYQKLQQGGFTEIKKADWDKTAKAALAAIDKL